MDTVAERYAESLFALASEEDAISSYLDDMKLKEVQYVLIDR